MKKFEKLVPLYLKFWNFKRRRILYAYFFSGFGLVALAFSSCGRKRKSDEISLLTTPAPAATLSPQTPSPQDPAAVLPTPTPETAMKPFWVASSSQRFLVRYDAAGSKQMIIDMQDLTGVFKGGITALTFFDPTTLLAFVDPVDDTLPKFIAAVDPKTGILKNKYWYQDSTNFKSTVVSGLVSGFVAKTVFIQTTKSVMRVLGLGDSGTDGSVFFSGSSVSSCTFDVIKNLGMIQGNNKRALISPSGGTSQKLNIIGFNAGVAACNQSYDYTAAGLPTSTADIPVNMVQNSDGKIFVLYQNPTASKIVGYDFDGTSLSGAKLVFQDQTVLGTRPTALAARTNKRLLVSNPEKAKIFEVSTSGDFTGFLLQSSYVVDAAVILTED